MMNKRIGIKSKLAGYFGTIIIAGLLINGIIASWLCEVIVSGKVEENLERLTIDCADKINIILHEKQLGIMSLSESAVLSDDQYSLEEKLQKLEKANSFLGFKDIAYVDVAGNSFGANGKSKNIMGSEDFMTAMSGEVTFSSAIQLEDETIFTIAVPIRNEKAEVAGVLLGVESMESFRKILVDAGISDEYFILDKKGRIISHSDENILENQMPMEEMPGHKAFDEIYEIYQKMLQGEKGIELCKSPETGIRNYLSYAPIKNGWSMGLVSYSSKERAHIKKFNLVVGLSTMSIMLVGVLAVYMVSQRLSVRINEIVVCLDGVAKGNFEKPIPKQLLEMKDEMGDVARALYHVKREIEEMLMTIKECTDYMNEQMEDFTGDVKEALKNVVVSQELNGEEMKDVKERVDNLTQITNFISASVGKSEIKDPKE